MSMCRNSYRHLAKKTFPAASQIPDIKHIEEIDMKMGDMYQCVLFNDIGRKSPGFYSAFKYYHYLDVRHPANGY